MTLLELERVLEKSKHKHGEILAEVEKCGGVNTIKSLQNHSSHVDLVQRGLAQRIIYKYFIQVTHVE